MADRTHPVISNRMGQGEEKSRPKTEVAHKRAVENEKLAEPESWPRGINGAPMAKLVMTASELIPTGPYANITVGPAQITAFVDLDRERGESFFSDGERIAMAQALNELAEIVEGDVVAVQRNLVMESMQDQLGK